MKGINWEVGSTWYADEFSHTGDYADAIKKIEADYDITLLSTCRSAIKEILNRTGNGRRALVPSFTCHSVIAPFITAGYEIKCYALKENLQIDVDALELMVEDFRPDIILVHGYFGFDTLAGAKEYLGSCRKRGIIVIEDMTQTMFSGFRHIVANYSIGSLRKWLPIPDGAFLKGLRVPGLSEDFGLADAKIKAMLAKYQYIADGKGAKKNFMEQFSEAETLLDSRTVTHGISNSALSALIESDFDEFSARRRDNYNSLARRLLSHPEISVIFDKAGSEDVPFMLPVYVDENLREFQRFMAQHNVYPTIIWKCPEELEKNIDRESHRIYDRILCFHVDQRYDTGDMNKVADIIDIYYLQK